MFQIGWNTTIVHCTVCNIYSLKQFIPEAKTWHIFNIAGEEEGEGGSTIHEREERDPLIGCLGALKS